NPFYAGILINPWTKMETPGKHEAVISRPEFVKLQSLRKGKLLRAPEVRKNEHPDFPLRRTVRCSTCSGPLTVSWSRGNGGKYAYYHCCTKHCTMYGKGTRKHHLEEEFIRLLSRVTPKPETVEVLKHAVLEALGEDQRVAADMTRRNARHRQELEDRM